MRAFVCFPQYPSGMPRTEIFEVQEKRSMLYVIRDKYPEARLFEVFPIDETHKVVPCCKAFQGSKELGHFALTEKYGTCQVVGPHGKVRDKCPYCGKPFQVVEV